MDERAIGRVGSLSYREQGKRQAEYVSGIGYYQEMKLLPVKNYKRSFGNLWEQNLWGRKPENKYFLLRKVLGIARLLGSQALCEPARVYQPGIYAH